MFRTVNDFLQIWQSEAEGTRRLLATLTDEALSYTNERFPRGVGRISQHIVESIPLFMNMIGDTVEDLAFGGQPISADDVRKDYDRLVEAVTSVAKEWSDNSMTQEVPLFGSQAPRGMALFVMLNHQTHHRGELVVLAREAGCASVNVYGPTREDMLAMGREPHP
jgi:uncharacterized damage-inducible protein DinB